MSGKVRTFKRYPKYKNSGVDWLGEIPLRWATAPLKHLANFVNGFAFKPDEWSAEGTPIIRIENLNSGEDFNRTTRRLTSRYIAKEGDLLFGWSGNRGTSFGPFLWWKTGDHYVNQHIFRIVDFEVDKNWLYWALRGVTSYIEQQAHGIIGMVHVTRGELGSVGIPVLPADEQSAIADFLSRETAKIDALVAKKERLIELLQEKRSALITRTVTKGLDPNVPMKDSAVSWFGDIPVHWIVTRTKYTLTDRIAGPFGSSLTKESYGGNRYRVYGQEQVIPGDFNVGDYYIPDSKFREMARFAIETDDVLVSCVGTFGKVAVVPAGVEPGIINPRLILLRPHVQTIMPKYLELFLKSHVSFSQLDAVTRGGTMDIINLSLVSEMLMPLPPTNEQARIVEQVEADVSRLDEIRLKAERAIMRLSELRSSLISAAVTGKIDVREEVA